MIKIKMFFKDVIGELRNPSEDSEKVLQTARKVLVIMLFFEIIIGLFGIASILFNNNILKIGFNNLLGLNMGLNGFLSYGLVYINYLLNLLISIYLFIVMNKSIKSHKPITGWMFIAILILSVLLPLIKYILGKYEFTFILVEFIQLLSESAIFYYFFYRLKKKEDSLAENNARIINVIIAICVLFVIFIIQTLVNFLIYLPENLEYIADLYRSYTMENVLYYLFPLINSLLAFLSLILVLVLFFTVINSIRYKKINRTIINWLFIIYSIINIIVFFINGGNQYWFLIISFLILSGYSSKNKLTEDFGKKFIIKVKTAVDNYFKFN